MTCTVCSDRPAARDGRCLTCSRYFRRTGKERSEFLRRKAELRYERWTIRRYVERTRGTA